MDPLVVAKLRREHERIAEDVDLLRSQCGAGEDPAERGAVSASLLARLRTHVEREERIVYEPLRRTARFGRLSGGWWAEVGSRHRSRLRSVTTTTSRPPKAV